MINWLELALCMASCLLADSVVREMGIKIPSWVIIIALIVIILCAYLDHRRHRKNESRNNT